MTVESASPGTLSNDDTLPPVVRLFVFADEDQRAEAAQRVRDELAELVPDAGAEVYEDVMPASPTLEVLSAAWREANPGQDPGARRNQRITIVVPDMSYAELADLSGPLAEAVSPGWSVGMAAARAEGSGRLPCRVAVGRADEHPGEPPLPYQEQS
ncbi:hypothetical protein KRX51_07940 [Corynebacterium sp. TAE3-ERU12]|uniref:hypothetical protein n=1 Tax=Corynebacterium sp. TAE3-ERU12 TaxID=2849491 RepID=UPI001C44FA17|nr:hypothetical protein [Corynebacterium sp. TAE3-ERU12]MBV7295842.1 hypothetical protein [Corynebacterium sp. TAE3-ERU12]